MGEVVIVQNRRLIIERASYYRGIVMQKLKYLKKSEPPADVRYASMFDEVYSANLKCNEYPCYYKPVRNEAVKACLNGATPKTALIAAGIPSATVEQAYLERAVNNKNAAMFDELYSATLKCINKLSAETINFLNNHHDRANIAANKDIAKIRLEFRDRIIKDLINEGYQENKNEPVLGDINITLNRVNDTETTNDKNT